MNSNDRQIRDQLKVAEAPHSKTISMTGISGINLINSFMSLGLYVGLGVWLVPINGVMGMAVVYAIREEPPECRSRYRVRGDCRRPAFRAHLL